MIDREEEYPGCADQDEGSTEEAGAAGGDEGRNRRRTDKGRGWPRGR